MVKEGVDNVVGEGESGSAMSRIGAAVERMAKLNTVSNKGRRGINVYILIRFGYCFYVFSGLIPVCMS